MFYMYISPVKGFGDVGFGGVLILKLLHHIIKITIQLKHEYEFHQSATFNSYLLNIFILVSLTNTVRYSNPKIHSYTKGKIHVVM